MVLTESTHFVSRESELVLLLSVRLPRSPCSVKITNFIVLKLAYRAFNSFGTSKDISRHDQINLKIYFIEEQPRTQRLTLTTCRVTTRRPGTQSRIAYSTVVQQLMSDGEDRMSGNSSGQY